jgi:hypothetical protein
VDASSHPLSVTNELSSKSELRATSAVQNGIGVEQWLTDIPEDDKEDRIISAKNTGAGGGGTLESTKLGGSTLESSMSVGSPRNSVSGHGISSYKFSRSRFVRTDMSLIHRNGFLM